MAGYSPSPHINMASIYEDTATVEEAYEATQRQAESLMSVGFTSFDEMEDIKGFSREDIDMYTRMYN